MLKLFYISLVLVALAAATPLAKMEINTNKKYELLWKKESRGINNSIKISKKLISAAEKTIVAITKKIERVNKQVEKITETITELNTNKTTIEASISTAEMKLAAAEKEKTSTDSINKEIASLQKQLDQIKSKQKSLKYRKLKKESYIKQLKAKVESIRSAIKKRLHAIEKYEQDKKELSTRLADEKSEELTHRRIYLTASIENKKISKEARKIEAQLGQETGQKRAQIHNRLKTIHNEITKTFIRIIDGTSKNIESLLDSIENEDKRHLLFVKKSTKRLHALTKQKNQLKKNKKKNSKRIENIKATIDAVKDSMDIESDRHSQQLDEYVRNILFLRISAARSEIEALRGEKKVLKHFRRSLAGKRCSINSKVLPEIKEALKKEQELLNERVKKASDRIIAVNQRILALKRRKEVIKKALKKISATQKLRIIQKLLRKIEAKNSKGNLAREVQHLTLKFKRAQVRYNTLRHIRDNAERDERVVEMQAFKDLVEKRNALKSIIKELSFRRQESGKNEQKYIAMMALQSGDCYRRRHLWKKVKLEQEKRKSFTKRLDKITLKFIQVTQEITRAEKEKTEKLNDAHKALVFKKKKITSKIESLKTSLKTENNESRFRHKTNQITDLKNDLKSLNDRIIGLRSEMRRTSSSVLLRKYTEEYHSKKALFDDVDIKLQKAEKTVAKYSKRIIKQQNLYENTILEKRKPIELRLNALKTERTKLQKKVQELKKQASQLESSYINQARKVLSFIKSTITTIKRSKKEYQTIGSKKSTEYKVHYERLTHVADNDINELMKLQTTYENKITLYNNKMVAFESELSPCKMCIELGQRAKQGLAMDMDNAQLSRNVQSRCKFFPEHERGRCYSMAFNIVSRATNVFDPSHFKIKNTCISLGECQAV
ncbi:Intracellular protein transport protein USO1 [Entamoeba marina]